MQPGKSLHGMETAQKSIGGAVMNQTLITIANKLVGLGKLMID